MHDDVLHNDVRKQMKLRYLRLAYGLLCLVSLGILYAWSVYSEAVRESLDCSVQSCGWAFTISIICFCLGGMVSSFVSQKTSPKLTLAMAALLLGAGFSLAARAKQVEAFYLFYGVVTALGIGMAYNVTISLINSWFSDKKGTIGGVAMMGISIGGMVMGAVGSACLAAIGWRETYRYFGVFYCLLLLAGVLLMRYPGTGASFPPDAGDAKTKKSLDDIPSLSPREMLRRPSFWLYFVWCTVIPIGGLVVISNTMRITQEFAANEAFGVFSVGLLSVVGGGARIVWGALYDKIGRTPTVRLLSVVAILAGAALLLAYRTGSTAILLVSLLFISFSYGGCPPIGTAFLQEFYGLKYFTMNFSVLNTSLLIASVCSGLIANTVYSATASYAGTAYVVIALDVLGALSIRFLKTP